MTKNYKEDFPLLANRDIAYLDSAATAQRPAAVLNAEREFYEQYNANPLRGLYELGIEATERYEQARERVRRFLNARSSREIIFTRNTTESINLAAYSYGLHFLKEGDEILVSIMEHHSNLLPWQMTARQTGAKLVFLECDAEGNFPESELDAKITERTKLAAVTQVSNVLGKENPLAEITRRVHARGGEVVADLAQSAPHMRVDVTTLDVDFAAFSGHKLMAPMGIGVLYGREELLEQMPPFLSGGEMIETVTRTGATYAELPHKFEAGTVNAGGAVALAAAIDYLESIGMETVAERESELTRQLCEGMREIPGVRILGSSDWREHHGIVSFTLADVHPHDIASILDADGVAIRAGHHCAQPLLAHLGVSSSARASVAFYNTEEDIARLLESLGQVRRKMGYGT